MEALLRFRANLKGWHKCGCLLFREFVQFVNHSTTKSTQSVVRESSEPFFSSVPVFGTAEKFGSVQDGIKTLRKDHMDSSQSLRRFPNVAQHGHTLLHQAQCKRWCTCSRSADDSGKLGISFWKTCLGVYLQDRHQTTHARRSAYKSLLLGRTLRPLHQ